MRKARILLVIVIVLALFLSLAPGAAFAYVPSPAPVSPDEFLNTTEQHSFNQVKTVSTRPNNNYLFLSDQENDALANMKPGTSQEIEFRMPFFWADVELNWATSDPDVATVTPLEGNKVQIDAVGPGTALIIVTTSDGVFTRSFEITVQQNIIQQL